MSAPEKQLKKWHIVLIVILSLILIAYLVFVATRFSGHTMYNPFTKRIFKIDGEQVSAVRIANGTTGNMVIYEEQDKIKETAGALNGFRYSRWKPAPPGQRDGWSYVIDLYIGEERCSYLFDGEVICVKGIWFTSSDSRLEELTKLVQGPPEETGQTGK